MNITAQEKHKLLDILYDLDLDFNTFLDYDYEVRRVMNALEDGLALASYDIDEEMAEDLHSELMPYA